MDGQIWNGHYFQINTSLNDIVDPEPPPQRIIAELQGKIARLESENADLKKQVSKQFCRIEDLERSNWHLRAFPICEKTYIDEDGNEYTEDEILEETDEEELDYAEYEGESEWDEDDLTPEEREDAIEAIEEALASGDIIRDGRSMEELIREYGP